MIRRTILQLIPLVLGLAMLGLAIIAGPIVETEESGHATTADHRGAQHGSSLPALARHVVAGLASPALHRPHPGLLAIGLLILAVGVPMGWRVRRACPTAPFAPAEVPNAARQVD